MSHRGERTVSVQLMRMALQAAERAGVSRQSVMAGLPLDPELLDRPDARVPIDVGDAVLCRLWEAARDPWLGLHMAERMQPGDSWFLHLAYSSPTFGAALQTIVRFGRLFGEGLAFELRRQGTQVALAIDLRARDQRQDVVVHVVLQAWLGVLARIAREQVLPPALPVGACVSYADEDAREYVRVLGVEPRFGAPVAQLAWPAGALERPMRGADAALHGVLRGYAQALLDAQPSGDELELRVREQVRLSLPTGEPSLEAIASRLALSTRTLQRTLRARGMRFSALVDDVRKQLALQYVQEPARSLDEIATLLGFSTTSAFSRAFRRWTGQSPGGLRARA